MSTRLTPFAALVVVLSSLAPTRADATFCSELGTSNPNLIVCDAADNPVYSDAFGWGLDDRGERGFPAFGTWDFGGSSIRSVDEGPNFLDTDNLSWKISTITNGLAYASFQSPMEIGDTLRLRWSGEDLQDAERIGISLHTGSTCQGAIFAVEREGGLCGALGCNPTFRLTDATHDDAGVPFGVFEISEVAFTLTGSTTYQLAINQQGLPADTFVGTIADAPVRGVCLRVRGQGTGLERVGYFNRITVTAPAPEPIAGLSAGAAAIALAMIARTRRAN